MAAYFALANAPNAVDLLNGHDVDLPPQPEFVKLNIGFASPIKLRFVQLESCKGEFSDGIDVMLHPGTRRVFTEGGKRRLKVKVPDDRAVSALSILFNHQAPPCLKNFELVGPDQRKIRLNAPARLPAAFERGRWAALFDLGFDRKTVMTSDHPLVLEFPETQQISRIHLWTGDALSSRTFTASEKLLRLSLAVDLQSPRTIELRPKPTVQTIELLPPLSGKKFSIQPNAKGEVSEIRFGIGTAAEARTFVPVSNERESALTKVFEDTGLSAILDHELTARGEPHPWHFRLRSDSTFFVYGYNDDEMRRGPFSAIGRFEILESSDKKIKFRFRGARVESGALWDGWMCGPACGETETRSSRDIDETIAIERVTSGFFMIRNRTPNSKRTLLFGDLKSKVSTLTE